ncbi:MAG: hypothetical protein WBG95_05220 [Sulfitobacter sp.]
MSTIDPNRRVGPQPSGRDYEVDGADINSALRQGTEVAVPLDIFNPEQLSTMISVVRRPPELPLNEIGAPLMTRAEDISTRDLLDISGITGSDDLGIRTVSLLVRRETEASASGDPMVRRGFEGVAMSARMQEHLNIMRTRGGA